MRDGTAPEGPAPSRLRARLVQRLSLPGAGLLLDVDGTLVDSEPMQQAAFVTYFTSRGWPVDTDVIRSFMGRRGEDSFAAVDGPWRGEDPRELTAAVIACLDPVTHPPVAVPGASAAIRDWRRAGVPVGLVTSARRPWAEHVIEVLGVGDLGLGIVTAEDTPAGKPAPEPFLLGARTIAAHPADCVAVEDSAAGLLSALAAGVGTVLGITTTASAASLRAAGAHDVIADLTPLRGR